MKKQSGKKIQKSFLESQALLLFWLSWVCFEKGPKMFSFFVKKCNFAADCFAIVRPKQSWIRHLDIDLKTNILILTFKVFHNFKLSSSFKCQSRVLWPVLSKILLPKYEVTKTLFWNKLYLFSLNRTSIWGSIPQLLS